MLTHFYLFFFTGIVAGNFLWDVIKGVSEGVEDSFKKGEGGKIKDMKEKLDKQFGRNRFACSSFWVYSSTSLLELNIIRFF